MLPKNTTVAVPGEDLELYCVLEGGNNQLNPVNLGKEDEFLWYKGDSKEPLKEDNVKYTMNRLNYTLTVSDLRKWSNF